MGIRGYLRLLLRLRPGQAVGEVLGGTLSIAAAQPFGCGSLSDCARSNDRISEAFKTALARGLVHAPHHQLLEDELRHLETRHGKVGHPTRGPVQTDDVAVALMNAVDHLLSDQNGHDIFQALGEGGVTGSQPHSYNPYDHHNPYSDVVGAVDQRPHSQGVPRVPTERCSRRLGLEGYHG